jgi:hypothetical protein
MSIPTLKVVEFTRQSTGGAYLREHQRSVVTDPIVSANTGKVRVHIMAE